MKICLLQFAVSPTPAYDEIARHLRLRGHEVWVTRSAENGTFLWDRGDGRRLVQKGLRPYPEKLPQMRVIQTAWRHLTHFTHVRRLRTMIKALQPDIVQVNASAHRYNSQMPLAMPKETAFILDFRQIGDRRRPSTLALRIRSKIRSVTRRISAIYFYDHSCYLHSLGAKKGLGERWQRWGSVVPLGVDASFLDSKKTDNGRTDETDAVRFIYVGSNIKRRQLNMIFQAIKTVAAKEHPFQFHFLGPDVDDGYFAENIRRLQLEQNVSLIPPLPYDQVAQRLLEYDSAMAYVPLEPTDWNYHPTLKVLEYRAVGIPIIATDVAPNREFVTPGYNGFLCDNSYEDFARAMQCFIEDPDLLVQVQENAQRDRTGMNWSEVSRMYEELYVRLRPG